MASVAFIRHGQSKAQVAQNAGHTLGGAEVALSRLGEQQAAALGQYWKSTNRKPPEVVFCSELLRAKQTLSIAWENAGWPAAPQFMDVWNEQNYGVMSHQSDELLWQKFPDLMNHKYQMGFWFFRPPAGENWEDVAKRSKSGVYQVRKVLAAGEDVMVFGHMVNFQTARLHCEGLTPHQLLEIDIRQIRNCNEISYNLVDGQFVLDRLYYRPSQVEALG